MKKILLTLTVLLFLLGGILIYQNIIYNDKRLHIVVCDVGQGDAILVRTPQGSDILIDGGPDNSVLNCLGKHLPFWDKTIEIAIATHPDADHITGFIDVIKRYKLIAFYTSKIAAKTSVYAELQKILDDYKVKKNYIWQGDRFKLADGLTLTTFWPTREWSSAETNSFSAVELLSYKNFQALFPGDIDAEQLVQVSHLIGDIGFMVTPHHGSGTGLSEGILGFLNPKLAAISVGKNNKYGHPAPFILDLLKSANIKTLRTDQVGEIEIISDGESWRVK